MMKKLDREKKKHAQPWLSMPIRFKHPLLRGVKKINFYTYLKNKNFVIVDAPDCLFLLCRYSQLIPKSLDLTSLLKNINKSLRAKKNLKVRRLKKSLFLHTHKQQPNI